MEALYISHTGMTEPLGQTQVIPYLKGLARAGWQIEIVAFEPSKSTEDEIEQIASKLRAAGLRYSWFRRSSSHFIGTKALEASKAVLQVIGRALKRQPRIVHARSYLPAAVADIVTSVTRKPKFIFDLRGLAADEFVEAGHWTASSWTYRLTKRMEKRLLGRADAIVVLTERHRRWIADEARLADASTPMHVIPCCVDLSRFDSAPDARASVRAQLGAGERFVLAYAGALGGTYMLDEMATFFAALRRRNPALFAVFTHWPTSDLEAALARAGVAREEVRFMRVPPPEMGRHLAAADAAICFMRPTFSRIGTSPTKVPEYLAAGLPVVINRGIGDSDQLLDEVPAMIDAGRFTPADLDRAAAAVFALDRPALRVPTRETAIQRYSLEGVGIPRYRRLYEELTR